MREKVVIYGVEMLLPEPPELSKIYGAELEKKEQYWRRTELPDFFETVSYNKDGDLVLTSEQQAYAKEEVRRCREGFWFMNKGKPTFLTGKHYFFLQWWKLEDDIYADYRDADRKYYTYLNHWENIKWCLGIVRGKHRRAGASSQACANLMYECIFFQNSKCGLISKSKDDSRDTFTDMVAYGYKKLPAFLQPKQLNSKDSVTELVFAQKSHTVKEGTVKVIEGMKGNQSRINYRAPVLNAYDRGKISRILLDEFGKLEKDVPASKLFSIISECLVKGIKRVGFVEMPSTVNELTKYGGAEYKIIWDNAKKYKRNGIVTVNRLVSYFNPAYEGLEGFIDKYGHSVIETPDEETYKWLVEKWVTYDEDTGVLTSEVTEDDIKLGGKLYLETTREGLTGDLLEEQIRKYPFDEEEMFMYAGTGCEFDAVAIQKQIRWIEDNPELCYLRQSRLVLKKEKIKSVVIGKPEKEKISVSPMDDERGGWFFFEFPNEPNKFYDRGGFYEPMNTNLYVIGVDTTSDNDVLNGSKPRALIMKKSCLVADENGVLQETGMKPVGMWLADKRLGVHFDEEIMKAALFFGCKIMYEIDYRDDYIRYFTKLGMRSFLEWTPTALRSPTKRNPKIEPGVRSGDAFQHYQQLQIAKTFVDGDSQDVYNGHVHRIVYPSLLKQLLKFDNTNRTKSDECICLFMSLVTMFGEDSVQKTKSAQAIKVLPQYKIKMVS